MTPIIEDARRRQRRRRIVAIGVACLAISTGAAVFGLRQFRAPSHTAGSTNLAKGASTTMTYVTTRSGGMTIRGRSTRGQITILPNFKVRNTRGGAVVAAVALDPKTGQVEVRLVNRQQP